MLIQQQVVKALRFTKWPRPDWTWPTLQSHRGFWLEGAQENTLASLKAAKSLGYEMAEIDVRLSRDQVPVLAHDKDLRRLANLDLRVEQLDAAELDSFELPTLAAVLKSTARPALMNIEIKKDNRLDSVLEKKVIEVIRESKKSEEILISSFNPLALLVFAQEAPRWPRALLIEAERWKEISYWRLIGNLAAQAHMVNWPYEILTPALVDLLRSQNIPVAAWTVNDYRCGKNLMSWGVQSLITDRIFPKRFEDKPR